MAMTAEELAAAAKAGAIAFKGRLLSAVDNIFTSELGDEEGGEYVLGPDFKPCTEHNMKTLRAWIEGFEP